MTAGNASLARRSRWHPVTIGCGLLGAALAGAAVALTGSPPGWWAPLAWTLAGAAAGFATSGST